MPASTTAGHTPASYEDFVVTAESTKLAGIEDHNGTAVLPWQGCVSWSWRKTANTHGIFKGSLLPAATYSAGTKWLNTGGITICAAFCFEGSFVQPDFWHASPQSVLAACTSVCSLLASDGAVLGCLCNWVSCATHCLLPALSSEIA